MKTRSVRTALTALAVALALSAPPSHALAPLIAMLGKKMLQDMLHNSLKDMLLESVSGIGCKGTALANSIRSAGSVKGMAAGLMPNLAAMPNMQGMPAVPGMQVMPGMPGMAGVPPEVAAMMSKMMPGSMPGGGLTGPNGLNAEQSQMLAALTGSMGAPLSPQETMGILDEMVELGMLPEATGADLKDCLLLVPQSAQALGMAMGMMKSTLPQIREARDQMHQLSADEQDELATVLAKELDQASESDRKQMLAGLRGGLFPPRVVDALNKRYGVR